MMETPGSAPAQPEAQCTTALQPPAITTHALGKCYRIYDRPQDRLKQALRWRGKQYFREFWALQDVNLQIRRGETVGIVGRNGSGKSTLLQLICGILQPTTGSLEVHGRVAALLELGAGFNPEFTGRENVFMNGAILGLSEAQIAERFDEIAAFSELGDFIDRPVKTYSSGMFVRLAFAVATSCEPDILVVDEALAVGDEAFQRKCFSRIERIRDRGGTILFVSHAAGTVVQLCDRACLLDQGELLLVGSPRSVVTAYQKLIHAPAERRSALRQQILTDADGAASEPTDGKPGPSAQSAAAGEAPSRSGYDPSLVSKSCVEYESQGARIHSAKITNLAGQEVNLLARREEYVLRYTVDFHRTCGGVRFGGMIKSVSGQELGGFVTTRDKCPLAVAGAQAEIALRFTCLLPPGVYFFNVGLRGTLDEEEVFLHRLVDSLAFRVLPEAGDELQGLFDFLMKPHVEYRLSNSEKHAA